MFSLSTLPPRCDGGTVYICVLLQLFGCFVNCPPGAAGFVRTSKSQPENLISRERKPPQQLIHSCLVVVSAAASVLAADRSIGKSIEKVLEKKYWRSIEKVLTKYWQI